MFVWCKKSSRLYRHGIYKVWLKTSWNVKTKRVNLPTESIKDWKLTEIITKIFYRGLPCGSMVYWLTHLLFNSKIPGFRLGRNTASLGGSEASVLPLPVSSLTNRSVASASSINSVPNQTCGSSHCEKWGSSRLLLWFRIEYRLQTFIYLFILAFKHFCSLKALLEPFCVTVA